VANYNVDIGVKVRGEELKRFGEQLKETQRQVNGVNRFLDTFRKQNIRVNESISNLNTQLRDAKTTFQNATIGTKQQVQAAKDLLQANENLNKGLKQQQELLNKLSGPSAKDNKKLQDGLLKLERQATKEQEQQFLLRQQGQDQLKQKVREINEQRKKENRLLKENVLRTKESVAAEIKKRFSIVAAAKQRRADLLVANRQVQTEIKINNILAARRRTQSASGGRAGGKGNLASSAIIGGAFPLLFGQTGTAAIGGATGGALGGLIGGQFGFALSIAGTAIGQYIDQQDKLNRSITKVNSLFVTMGNGVGFTAKEIKKLGKEIGVTAEEIVQMVDASKRFGKEGSDALISFFGADFSKRMGQIDAIAQVDSLANSLKAIQALGKDLTLEEEFRLINMARQEGSLAVQIELQRILLELQHKQNLQEAERIKLGTRFNIQMAKAAVSVYEGLTGRKGLEVKNLNQIIQDQIDETIRKYEEMDEKLLQQIEKIKALAAAYSDGRLTIADEIDSINKKLKIMMDVQTQVVEVSREIKDSFAESFKEVVKGTMTVTDAFRNMLNRIADYFLDTAAQLLAMQLQQGFLGFMSNLFPSLKTSKHGVDGERADGGPVRSGGTYLVGEEGPELFTPGISGGITPNYALGGSTNISVNIDASGTSVEGSEPNGEELGRLVAAAIQSELIKEKRPGGLLS